MTQNQSNATSIIQKSVTIEKDLDQWMNISVMLNLLLTYALPVMGKDGALVDNENLNNLQEMLFFKTELDSTIKKDVFESN